MNRQQFWQIAAIAVALVFTSAAAAQVPRQADLRAMVQQLLAENRPLREQGNPDDPVPSTPIVYDKPIVSLQKDGLWYDFGAVSIDEEYYQICVPVDRSPGGQFDPNRNDLLDGPPPPAAPPAPPPPPEEEDADDAPVPIGVGFRPPQWNPLYFPIKAQLTAELIRKYRMETQEQRAGWGPVVDEIERIVALELSAIGKPRQPEPPPEEFSELNRPPEEPLATLFDGDDLVCRTVLGYLDRIAKQNGVLVRRLGDSNAATLFGFDVSLIAEPAAAKVYFISAFRYKCLQRTGKELDFSFWHEVTGNLANVAGNCHFAAVWKKDGKTTVSNVDQVQRITKESQLRLTPAKELAGP